MSFDQNGFNDFVLENKIVGVKEEPFTLKSKRKSNWYANWRLNDVYVINVLSDYVTEFTEDQIGGTERVDCFYGVPEGVTRLAVMTQYKWAMKSPDYGPGSHVLPMGRGKPKEHGDPRNKYFVGEPRGKTLVLEDVTTTGGSTLKEIAKLKGMKDVDIVGVVGLFHRMEKTPIPGKDDEGVVGEYREIFKKAAEKEYKNYMSVEQALFEAGVSYYSMTDARNMLPLVVKDLNPPEDVVRKIGKEIEDYGTVKINLR